MIPLYGGVLIEYIGIDYNSNPIWLLHPAQFSKNSITLFIPNFILPFTYTLRVKPLYVCESSCNYILTTESKTNGSPHIYLRYMDGLYGYFLPFNTKYTLSAAYESIW